MTPNHPRDAEEIVLEARRMRASRRERFLDEACQGDPQLRERVEQKLARSEGVSAPHASLDPATAAAAERDSAEDESTDWRPGGPGLREEVPERVGRYRIVRRVAEGGMGVVYEAVQEEPVHRKVAIKLVKWGMNTRDVISRFESERQALALMNHPSIANVYDAGATDDGRPYFAMEYVQGIPITEYCDKHRLTIEERLELFIEVCDGIQHAHQKGVIHRDVKPSNVLVSVRGERPAPKIIDFGVAKAVSQRLTEHTVYTELGQLIGTPEYMSPEQAEMTNLDIDTRTDVYSLGVLLYELLVGERPFDSASLRGGGLLQIQRALREEEPPTPSTRVKSLADTLEGPARNRGLDARSLRRSLRGDLDWVVMKAIEKDRTRRYETANALALDVRRFLDDEPVRAHAPSAAYRFRKLVRRHRTAVVSALAVVLALVAGLFVATAGMLRARQAERLATEEAAKARAINEFMQRALGAANPQEGLGREITVLEALARASRELEGSFEAQPAVEAAVRSNIGLTYVRLGRYEEAEPFIERALRMQESVYGRRNLEVAETLTRLSTLRLEQGYYDRAEAAEREALEIRRALLGEDAPLVAQSLDNLGLMASYARGDFATAEELHRNALHIRTRHLPEGSEEVVRNTNNLAMALYRQEKYEEAEALFRRSIQLNRSGARADELDVTLHNNLGLLLRDIGEFDRALEAFDSALEGTKVIYGERHPEVASRLNNLGALQTRMGEYAAAEATHREALALAEEAFGEGHFVAATTRSLLADAIMEQERLEEAEGMLVEAYQDLRTAFPDSHPRTQATLRRLVEVYERMSQPEDAQLYRALLN